MAIEQQTRDREPIQRDATYTVAQFLHRTAMGRNGLRAAERRGLKTVRVGGRKFIRGEDWHSYLAEQGGQDQ